LGEHESEQENLIGVGVVVLLGAMAFASVKFKRQDGIVVNIEKIQKRDLQAIVVGLGQRSSRKRLVNISADTMGRVTDLRVEEGQRVAKGQFLLQIDPRNLTTAYNQTQASLAAARSQMEGLRVSVDSQKAALKQAQDGYARQQQLWKGGLTTKETLDNAEQQVKMRKRTSNSAERQIETQRLRMTQEEGRAREREAEPEQGPDRVPPSPASSRAGTSRKGNGRHRDHDNAGTQFADDRRHVGSSRRRFEVDETDIPNVSLGQKAKITIDAKSGQSFAGHVVEIGNSPIQAAGSTSASQATNFLVKVVVDGAIPDVRPGFTCTAEITTATRPGVVAVPIQATTVREEESSTRAATWCPRRTRPAGSA